MKSKSVTIQMKATEQFSVVLFIMLYNVVHTFESVKEILLKVFIIQTKGIE